MPGDRLPPCVGVAADGALATPDGLAGRAALVVLDNRAPDAVLDALIAACVQARAALEAMAIDVFVLCHVGSGPRAWNSGPAVRAGLRVFLCPGDLFAACGVMRGDFGALLIDRDRRVVVSGDDVGALLQAAAGIRREVPRHSVTPAPVIAIPGLLDPALCATLIARFEAGGSFESGVSGTAASGAAHDRVDASRKRRRDWLLEPDDALHARVLDLLRRRCVPDIKRAFQHDMTRIDRIIVARYDERGGFFRRHRDNGNDAVAFRQFALSVNLNAGEYDGGGLLFPEFNDHVHAPATGEGLVFSTSLLHEALPVTRGARYVLLTFLYDGRSVLPAAVTEKRTEVILGAA